MIKTLSPYSNGPSAAKTAEIMSRYRPIAPKPELPLTGDQTPSPTASSSPTSSSSLSQKIRHSPYLRNLWPQLQARPTRTRKRGRTAISPPAAAAVKRQRSSHATPNNLSFHPFTRHHHLSLPIPAAGSPENMGASPRSLVTLPLLPCPTNSEDLGEVVTVDLSLAGGSHAAAAISIPEEKDLLQQLQKTTAVVIAPQPVRPVGSSISVGSICSEAADVITSLQPQTVKEVEEELESEALPAVISDCNHKVRLANSAYKEMVGQPECPWLDSMVGGGSPCRRISGEVVLRICGDHHQKVPPVLSDKFSCWVRIEWGNQGNKKKKTVDAFCDVRRLFCESKDYLFSWRFHTNTRTRPAAQPTSV